MRELIALDTAEAATDPADSSAGTAGDRCHNHAGTAGRYAVLPGAAQRRAPRRDWGGGERRGGGGGGGWGTGPTQREGWKGSSPGRPAPIKLCAYCIQVSFWLGR